MCTCNRTRIWTRAYAIATARALHYSKFFSPLFFSLFFSSCVASTICRRLTFPRTRACRGWLKTFDEYLVGRNNSIQQAGVQWIFSSVLQALQRDANRKFTLVETGFFIRWYEMQVPAVQASVQELLGSEQFTFIMGQYVMPDEATPTYIDIVDQMTLGARILNASFGVRTRMGWQVDPFGHSASFSVLEALSGHAAMYYGRTDYAERSARIAANATEYVWRPSRALGSTAQILAGLNVNGYDPPILEGLPGPYMPEFEWDVKSDNDNNHPPLRYGPFQPDPQIDGFNVLEYVSATLALARLQASYTLPDADGTVHIAWQMGTDFNYAQAEMWFTQLDGLIHYTNLNTSAHGVNLLYSTPQQYVDAKLAQDTAWPLKNATALASDGSGEAVSSDQFPYSTNPHWVSKRPIYRVHPTSQRAF